MSTPIFPSQVLLTLPVEHPSSLVCTVRLLLLLCSLFAFAAGRLTVKFHPRTVTVSPGIGSMALLLLPHGLGFLCLFLVTMCAWFSLSVTQAASLSELTSSAFLHPLKFCNCKHLTISNFPGPSCLPQFCASYSYRQIASSCPSMTPLSPLSKYHFLQEALSDCLSRMSCPLQPLQLMCFLLSCSVPVFCLLVQILTRPLESPVDRLGGHSAL